jgi:hypothetical protein
MQLTCPHCSRILEITGEPPSFCAYCGHSLSGKNVIATVTLDHEGATQPPTDTAPLDVERPPEVIGGYRLLRQIGSGGMGTVHEAEEIASGRRVAVKIISRQFGATSQMVERFRQEGRLASLITHPRCVFVLAADEEKGQPYIVMELMTGETLQELIDRKGPLPVEEAITKILDVIEGLEEAHRNGVIHRDVKPSNCFLEPDGHVKIGDFGLSKSLVQGAHLTRTGSFLGTPLYASPEQVRAEPVDEQTDIYSVAATLYFLLTGRAPHQTGDAAATLARIVADDAPSMRGFRKELPEELDQVVLRGLKRQREERWRSLGDFREALRAFLPGQLSIGSLGIRFGAYMIDVLIIYVVQIVAALLIEEARLLPKWQIIIPIVFYVLLATSYYGVFDGLWEATPGKRLVSLRVRRRSGVGRPGILRGLARAGIFCLALQSGTLAQAALLGHYLPSQSNQDVMELFNQHPFIGLLLMVLPWGGYFLGALLLFSVARARNGYRGFHELLSGTRIVSLPLLYRRKVFAAADAAPCISFPKELPERLGPYRIEGALLWTEAGRILTGTDLTLGRPVWIWIRAGSQPALSPQRRQVTRLSRLRLLATGCIDDKQWDAFVAPSGCLLPDLVTRFGRLSWAETRPLLEELADELELATGEDTLAQTLALEQIWIQPNGRTLLLDMPLRERSRKSLAATREAEATTLLAEAAILALEGKERAALDTPPRVQAPIPEHASWLVARLLPGGRSRVRPLEQFQQELHRMHERPVEVTRARRTAHVAVLGALLLVGLLPMFTAGWIPQLAGTMNRFMLLRMQETELDRFRASASVDLTSSIATADPFDGIRGVLQCRADEQHLQPRLERVTAAREEHQARLQALSSNIRAQMQVIEQANESAFEKLGNSYQNAMIRNNPGFTTGLEFERMSRILEGEVPRWLILAPPILWIVWSFITRGGVSLPITELQLVGRHGRRAARWRCAWRALLLWTPVVLLLLGSHYLELSYWMQWQLGAIEPWRLWTSSILWWAAATLLLGYAVLALWFPARGIHDRLAGTYLVPA